MPLAAQNAGLMTFEILYSRSYSISPLRRLTRPHHDSPNPPRKPDWLVLLMIGIFLLILLIAWFVDIPSLLD